jgi:flagellar biosynthesis/type III secretory pathway chaperone
MTSDKAIVSILIEQVKSYKILLNLLNDERKSLIEIDADRIENISKEKDTVVMRLRLLEEERQRLLAEFISDNNIENEISLIELGKFIGNSQILELRSQLISLLQSIEEMNKFNTVLIDRSIQQVRTASSFFNSFPTKSTSAQTGVLLSKES